uniref:PSI domain-containing protein n=1 Tax=Trieres chinensis TaxID=1514140 RepID=A0A6U1V0A1_TRICV|mmetsp:Transcript_24776/g.50289  ORF Transcript_24776/g.50289 Transcript_24776/m.50289 type:complete len:119 (+) Transcript_24776:215-571(+)
MKLAISPLVSILLISSVGASSATGSFVDADVDLGGSMTGMKKPKANLHGRRTQTIDPYSCSRAKSCCKCSDKNCSDLTSAKKYRKCIRKNCKSRCRKAAGKCYGDKNRATEVAIEECW